MIYEMKQTPMGIVDVDDQGYMTSALIRDCHKCGGYMRTIPIDITTASLLGTLGRWRCMKCGWIPSLKIYDKEDS